MSYYGKHKVETKIYFTPSQMEGLKAIARKTDRSISEIMRELVSKYLEGSNGKGM